MTYVLITNILTKLKPSKDEQILTSSKGLLKLLLMKNGACRIWQLISINHPWTWIQKTLYFIFKSNNLFLSCWFSFSFLKSNVNYIWNSQQGIIGYCWDIWGVMYLQGIKVKSLYINHKIHHHLIIIHVLN